MNKIRNFYNIAVVLLAMIVTGCAKNVNIPEINKENNKENSKEYRITAAVNPDSKVQIEGTSITWKADDVIYVTKLSDSCFVDVNEFKIDAETISDDGKYAEFVGTGITIGEEYIATTSPIKISAENPKIIVLDSNISAQTASNDFGHINDNWDAVSQFFSTTDNLISSLTFMNIRSILSINISMSPDVAEDFDLTQVSISGGNNFFNKKWEMYIDGDLSPHTESHNIYQDIENDAIINRDNNYVVNIPVYIGIEDGDSPFVFTFISKDGKCATMGLTSQDLIHGKLYTLDYELDGNFTQVGCDLVQRAALMDIYNANNGDEWGSNTNWGSYLPFDQWDGLYTNNDGDVARIVFYSNSNNVITTLPKSIENLTNLEQMIIQGSKLESLPVEIGNLTNLTSLNIGSNQLTTIPAEIGNLTNLTSLNIGSNQLTTIPAEIGNLTNLFNLNLYSNQLTTIPEWLGSLTNLTNVDISMNKINGAIPAAVKENPNYSNWIFSPQQDGYAIDDADLIPLEFEKLYGRFGYYYVDNGHRGLHSLNIISDIVSGSMVRPNKSNGWYWSDYTFSGMTTNLGGEDNSTNQYSWELLYTQVCEANSLVDRLADVVESDDTKLMTARVKMARALSYYMLTVLYSTTWEEGNGSQVAIPIVDSDDINESYSLSESTLSEVLDYIAKDITDAITIFGSISDARNTSYMGIDAARLLMARLEMYRHNYTTAAEYAKAVATNYSIMGMDTYSTGFNDRNINECIFGITPPQPNYFGSLFAYLAPNYNSSFTRSGPMTIDTRYLNAIPDSDSRKSLYVTDDQATIDNNGNFYYYNLGFSPTSTSLMFTGVSKKFLTTNPTSTTGDGDIILMRAAEAYYIAAEAYAKVGNLSEAAQFLAAAVTPYDNTFVAATTQDELLTQIENYKVFDMYGEGRAYEDFKRRGKLVDRTGSNHSTEMVLEQYGPLSSQPNSWAWTYVIPKNPNADNTPQMSKSSSSDVAAKF